MGAILAKLGEIKKLEKFAKEWKKRNTNNYTKPVNVFNPNNVSVGNYSYGDLRVLNDTSNAELIIGNFCSIADNVTFLVGMEHNIKNISTFPFKYYFNNEELEATSKGNINIDDDVWIGEGATILSGVHIGQGAVIGAKSVVTKDVPPYAVVVGAPAKVIKYRFSSAKIKQLMKIDYSKLDESEIKKHLKDLYKNFNDIESFSWMPKR